jgi:tetratricopeptide (TPR) repeat protein
MRYGLASIVGRAIPCLGRVALVLTLPPLALLATAPVVDSLAVSPVAVGAEQQTGGGTAAPSQADVDRRVQELIQQLGSPQYASRERAQAELQRAGLSAFDALLGAQQDEDIEIALRARYLLRSMQVNWAQETDPPEVKRVLKSYGEQVSDERHNRMVRLSKLTDLQGLDALCRLARFETSDILSKQAALLVMSQGQLDDAEQRAMLAERIGRSLGISKRAAGIWLQTFMQTLKAPDATIAQWRTLCRTEQETLAQYPEKSSRPIVRDLLRWNADTLFRLDRQEDAAAAIRDSLNLLDGSREELLDMVDWLMVRSKWTLVSQVAEHFPELFREDAQLAYRMAEAALKQGREAEADAAAQQARKLNPEDADEHILAAYSLQERGMRDWAEAEYRAAIAMSPPGSLEDLRSRFLLSELLHDFQQDLEAAEVLQDVVTRMDSEEVVMQRVKARLGREPGSVRSRLHFFQAMHHLAQNERAKMLEHLNKGVEDDPGDADLLIAMYRVSDPTPEFRKKTLDYINRAAQQFRQQVAEYEQQAEQAPQEEFRAWAFRQLAMAHNQLAWLVANTTGDYDEALRSSLRSLELRPGESGYLDTLGRCYFAKGDYASAVKYQAEAVKLDPHSGQIVRQLKLFQKVLEDSRKGAGVKPDKDQAPAPSAP